MTNRAKEKDAKWTKKSAGNNDFRLGSVLAGGTILHNRANLESANGGLPEANFSD